MRACTKALAVLFLTSACATPEPPAFPRGELVDLSHTYDEQTIYWPTAEGFQLRKDAEGVTPAGYYYAANNLFTSEHGGTHIDAPIHFAQGHQTVDQIPLERLIGPAVVIDVTEAERPQRRLSGDHRRHRALRARARRDSRRRDRPHPHGLLAAMARCGAISRHGRRGEPRARSQLHFPGLHPDAARWIVANRRIGAIGIDTASIDYGQSTLFESHRILYERDVPAFENLTALDRLPVTGAYVIALPMKIGGGSGAPLRAVAVLPGR